MISFHMAPAASDSYLCNACAENTSVFELRVGASNMINVTRLCPRCAASMIEAGCKMFAHKIRVDTQPQAQHQTVVKNELIAEPIGMEDIPIS